MRQFLNFDKDDGDLVLHLRFNAEQIAGTYTFTFWDKQGRDVISHRGRVMAEVPPIPLPSPAFMNDGALAEVNCTIVGLVAPGDGINYEVSATVMQGEKSLGPAAVDSKPLKEGGQVGTVFVFLEMVSKEPEENPAS